MSEMVQQKQPPPLIKKKLFFLCYEIIYNFRMPDLQKK